MHRRTSIQFYDHEVLSQLAREDPVAFEKLRGNLIADFIDGQPEEYQRRLRGLQFRVEGIRRLSHSPLAVLVKIQALMWESFFTMNQEQQNLVQFLNGDAVKKKETSRPITGASHPCQLMEFPRALINRDR